MISESEAHAKLEEAIEAFLESIGQPGLLMDWVVITHKLSANEDGTNDFDTGWVGSEHQPLYRTLGLLDYARTCVMRSISNDMEED